MLGSAVICLLNRYVAMILGSMMVNKRVMSIDHCPTDLQCQIGKS